MNRNMQFADSRKMRLMLWLSVAAGCVMMLISYWMDGTGLRTGAEALSFRPLWIYTLCMLLAMLGVPAMCAGLLAWYRIVRSLQAKFWVQSLFVASAISYAISSLYIIAIDCLPPIVYQTAESIGISPAAALTLIERIEKPYTVPIIAYFLIEDLGISAVLWQLIGSGKLPVPKWMLVCCPAVMLILDILLKCFPSALAQNVSVTLESCGWMLFMVVGIVYLRRSEKRNDRA